MHYIIYLGGISILAVTLTLLDKRAARNKAWRLKESTLLFVSVLGGSVAMLVTMLAIRHKTRHTKFMVGLPILIFIQTTVIMLALNSSLSVSHYTVETDKINDSIRLALVADLHSCYYGDELIKAVDFEQPDAVLLCGDIFDDILPPENAIAFVEEASRKYPCYYVSGNHEFWSGRADQFKASLISYGVEVLEGTSGILEVGGDKIRISGIDDPDTDRYASRSVSYAEQLGLLKEELSDELFTVLLSHRPERINEFLMLKPELVLSGHAHGGQWRIPFFLENGLLSPNQGLFPKYTTGEHFFDEMVMIVSRGLARESTKAVPRIFNRPEIVVVTLK